MSYTQPARTTRGRPRRTIYSVRRRRALLGAVIAAGAVSATFGFADHLLGGKAAPSQVRVSARRLVHGGRVAQLSLTRVAWPPQGQAALALGSGQPAASPDQQPVAIASVAKVMTAFLVLQRYPLSATQDGFTVTITPAEAEQAARDAAQDESFAAVQAGERLTERQLLEALLIPSGNNIAQLLAAHVAGSETSFVGEMNDEARALGMDHTTYTDPSGWDPRTVSTAADQLRVLQRAMHSAAFRQIVSMASVTLPVAGTLTNTNPLIADGYFGKTGSDSAAGGCLAFFTHITLAGRPLTVAGVVLGQGQGNDTQEILAAAGHAAQQLIASASSRPRAGTETSHVQG